MTAFLAWIDTYLAWIVLGGMFLAFVGFVAFLHNESNKGWLIPPKYKTVSQGVNHWSESHRWDDVDYNITFQEPIKPLEVNGDAWSHVQVDVADKLGEMLHERGRAVDVRSRDTNIIEGGRSEN